MDVNKVDNKTDDKKNKNKERLEKLKQLHLKRSEGSRINHQEVVEEYKRSQLPKNWQSKREWAEKKLEEEEIKTKAIEDGIDYQRYKLLDVQADEAERKETRKQSKKSYEPGYSGYEAATVKQYMKNVKSIRPDMEEYDRLKEELGDETFYAGKDTIIQNTRKDSKEGIERMVEDLNKQLERKAKRKGRSAYDDDEDIDYINKKNMKFNKKVEKFYGKYTKEIKQNLERGTAV